jgi:hypothetical protein
MVDEKDDSYESHEEGEYHFSDDQANYDFDMDSPKKAEPLSAQTPPLSSAKEAALQKLSQHRRMVVGLVVFIVLISVVYKMLTPAGNEKPPTEFAPPVAKVTKPAAPTKPETPAASQLAQTAPATPLPAPALGAPLPATLTPPTTTPVMAEQAVAQMPMTAPLAPTQQATPSTQVPVSPSAEVSQPLAVQVNPASAPSSPVVMAAAPSAPPADANTKNIMDRLASLEQQNAALMNLLQTEYAQKMADYETQNTMTRGKLEEVTKRLNRMDTALNQISQALQGSSGSPGAGIMDERAIPAAPVAAMKVMEPKGVYTVQAIIPGRAWLKSESGETVTVAEGDILKNYGRITKIDPYDGVVDIDTGNKMITLSYGTNLE